VLAGAAVLVGTTIGGLAIGALPANARPRAARRLLRGTASALMRIFGIHVSQTGPALPSSRALVVANHISWLDILALFATADVRLVAKSEVAAWPIVGRLARLSGAIFIDRNRPRALPATVAQIRDAMVAGQVVAVFAEGTTGCGDHRVPYRPAAFQAAIDAEARVVPMALRYHLGDGASTPLPAFIGDETLLTSLRRVLDTPSIWLDIRVGASLYPHAGGSRRILARTAQSATPIGGVVVPMPASAKRARSGSHLRGRRTVTVPGSDRRAAA
jgi:1-acyl-sn-glycerol-3-phosphate acyltransferase